MLAVSRFIFSGKSVITTNKNMHLYYYSITLVLFYGSGEST